MGFGDFSEDIDKSSDDQEAQKKEKARYERITTDDMVKFLNNLEKDHGINWSYPDMRGGESSHRRFDQELVYQIDLDEPRLSIYLFSSINSRTGLAREKGGDAIRTVIWDKESGRPVGGKKRTNRIKTWRKNLKPKILELKEEWGEHVTECDVCGGWMVKREGEYGEFLGCTNYPECHNTEQIK